LGGDTDTDTDRGGNGKNKKIPRTSSLKCHPGGERGEGRWKMGELVDRTKDC
jgi:hypothetical protein